MDAIAVNQQILKILTFLQADLDSAILNTHKIKTLLLQQNFLSSWARGMVYKNLWTSEAL